MSGLVKKGDKGLDLLASLCNKYDTSEEELRKAMQKTNDLIQNILKKKPCLASECKNENFENLATGVLYIFLCTWRMMDILTDAMCLMHLKI